MVEHLHRFERLRQALLVDRELALEFEHIEVVTVIQLHELTEVSQTLEAT